MDTFSDEHLAELRAALHIPLSPLIATESLQHEIIELSAHLNAATYRWLVLVGEFDRSDGWAGEGVASCAHWLTWRCGVGRAAAHEKVRVARSLERLPLIAEAFRTGEVSYSKVRAMTRVATPENEACLLEIAWYGTATHVERTVQGYRRALEGQELERAEPL